MALVVGESRPKVDGWIDCFLCCKIVEKKQRHYMWGLMMLSQSSVVGLVKTEETVGCCYTRWIFFVSPSGKWVLLTVVGSNRGGELEEELLKVLALMMG